MAKKYIVLETGYVQFEENGFVNTIPNDPANSDYQRYLRWLENPDADESGTL
jgi:hypothetical protein